MCCFSTTELPQASYPTHRPGFAGFPERFRQTHSNNQPALKMEYRQTDCLPASSVWAMLVHGTLRSELLFQPD